MDTLSSLLKQQAMLTEIEANLIATIIALFFLWLIRAIVVFVAHHHHQDAQVRFRVRKTVGYLVGFAGVFLIGRIWFGGFADLATFLGLISAGLVIALRELLVDIVAWLFIVWRKPFRIGDRVQLGAMAGDVIDIRLFQFTILEIGNWVDADQSTGRVVHIPNGKVFTEMQANYTEGFDYIWNEIPVTVTFESNWKKAKQILYLIAMRHTGDSCEMARRQVHAASNMYYIHYSTFTPTVYTSVKDHYGIVLTIRYLSRPRRRRGTEQEMWEDILLEFARCEDVSFAYPTYRMYSRAVEGPTRPPLVDETDEVVEQLNSLHPHNDDEEWRAMQAAAEAMQSGIPTEMLDGNEPERQPAHSTMGNGQTRPDDTRRSPL